MGAFLLAAVSFGAMAVAVRVAAHDMPAVQVAWVRCAGSLAVLLVLTRGRGLVPRPGNLGRAVLRGALGATSLTLYYVAVAWAGAGLGTLVHSTYPVWTALWATVRLGEPFGRRILLALVLNLVGAAVAVGPDVATGSRVGVGGLVGLAAGMLAGGAVATAGELRRSESTLLVTTWFMGMGTLLLAPTLCLGAPPLTAPLVGALAATVGTSLVGQLLLHHGLGHASPTAGALATATSVVTAAVAEAALLGTVIPPRVAGAAVLMLAAVWLVSVRSDAGRSG